VGGGEFVAPWQLVAEQPVRGHVIVVELSEPPDAPEPSDVAPLLDAPAPALEPVMAWQVVDVQPVAGHRYVWPAGAVAEATEVPVVAVALPAAAWTPV